MTSSRRIPLACTVRGCGRPLLQGDRQWACDRGHTFDSARRGYVNLLQPQDRRSLRAGDSAEAVAARARLLEAGVGRTIVDAVVAATRGLPPDAIVAELGCGGGDVLGAVAAGAIGVGIDLSVPAVERAARRFPDLRWVVANTDRGVPLLDASVDLTLSFHGRRHPAECVRTLRPAGRLIVVVPAADDLVELRQAVLGLGALDDRGDAVLAEHRDGFALLDRVVVREQHTLTREQLLDALQGTYRGGRSSQHAAVADLETLTVTVASEILVFHVQPVG